MFVRATCALLVLTCVPAIAEEMHGMSMDMEMGEHSKHARMMEAMSGPLDVPLQQNASGTAWQPAISPMYGHMWLAGDWSLMLHYLVFAGADLQGSDRGSSEAFTTNWVMGMAQHPLLGGRFIGRVMLSFEPVFLGQDGYPLLLQTGETAHGQPLIDRQHPHDLFMEVAALYQRQLAGPLAFELYLAPSGEPALGPPAFPHRLSAMSDPLAPITHHWLDSTHITFGVITAGLYTRNVKLEGSWFNGREPNENRYDFDLRVPDSYSVRLSVNPAEGWSGQVSYGFLREPEPVLEPGASLHRITASVIYDRRMGEDGNWATTFAWGQNRAQHGGPSNGWLLESDLLFENNNVFVRGEYVVKTGEEFALPEPLTDQHFPVGVIALGYVRDFGPFAGLFPGVGVRGSMNFISEDLDARYGTPLPLGLVLFLRLRPAEMMHGMARE